MKKIWTMAAVVFLLCLLARGFVLAQQSSLDWGEELGTDMCPECKPLPVLTRTPHTLPEEDLGVDMCPEKGQPMSVAKNHPLATDCNSLEKGQQQQGNVEQSQIDEQSLLDWAADLGVDMCPECRPLPPLVRTETPFNLHEEDMGVDMCPEKGQPMSVAETHPSATDCKSSVKELQQPVKVEQSQIDQQSLLDWAGNLGMDMCPECRPLPPLMLTETSYNSDEEDLGVDMCPEKGQPLSVTENHLVFLPATKSSSLVEKLQQLVNKQQLQIDQLAILLQQLGETRTRVDLEVVDKSEEQTPMSTDLSVRVADVEVPEQQPLGDALSVDLTNRGEQQNLVGTRVGGNAATTQGEIGVVPADGEDLRSGARSVTVARYRPAWSEHFSFLSAVKVDGEVSCLHVLPQEGEDGLSRYVVVGDISGRLHIFLWLGDLLIDFPTISTAPITAMLSYAVQKNETILVTGHGDGGVLVHRIWETVEQGSFSKDGSTKLASIETLHSLVSPSSLSMRVTGEDRKEVDQEINLSMHNKDDAKSEREGSLSVSILEMYKVGKMRYTLVGDMSGKIQLFRDNGSRHGVAHSPSRPLTFMRTTSAQRLVFLTEVGVGSLDLRNMQVRSSVCEGLNTSTVMAYAFDVTGRTRATGFTAEGDLVSVVLTGDILHFQCQVKKKRKLEIAGPFAPQALKGYLVAATPDHVLVFNTTLQTGSSYANFWVAGPRPLFSVTINEIARSFLKTPIPQIQWPVLASNRDKLVVVGFGDGYVGIFRSNLPTSKPADFSSKFWVGYIVVIALILLGMWQLFPKRQEPGVVVSSEYPLGGSSGSLPDERVESDSLGFGQSEKVAEPRRFRSPTRGYVAGNPSFGRDSRSFRQPAVDTGGYSSRREPLFSSTQPVGDAQRLQ